MPLSKVTVTQHKSVFLHILSYRIPMPVKEVLLFSSGDSYPICPRCDEPTDREYMHFCDQCGQRLSWVHFNSATIVHAPRRKKLGTSLLE